VLLCDRIVKGRINMTTKNSETVQETIFKRVAREQFDAFERQERLIRMEERRERAAQLRLPTSLKTKSNKSPAEIGKCVKRSSVSGIGAAASIAFLTLWFRAQPLNYALPRFKRPR
jgi:hypothetical protein